MTHKYPFAKTLSLRAKEGGGKESTHKNRPQMAVADDYGTPDIFGFDKQFQDAGYHRLEPAVK